MFNNGNMENCEMIKMSKYFNILCEHTSMIAKAKILTSKKNQP
jgi:hypothetical protein